MDADTAATWTEELEFPNSGDTILISCPAVECVQGFGHGQDRQNRCAERASRPHRKGEAVDKGRSLVIELSMVSPELRTV
jgi:hypothetical protein